MPTLSVQEAAVLEHELSHYTGDGDQYRHWTGRIRFTEGVRHLAERAGAYWLIDLVASHQSRKVVQACGGFQVWTLEVDLQKRSAVATCRRDAGEPAIVRQRIPFTDFPMAVVKLWLDGPVLMLPTEY